jgi:hypothetical protein
MQNRLRRPEVHLYSFRVKIAVIARRFLPKQSLCFQKIASLACGARGCRACPAAGQGRVQGRRIKTANGFKQNGLPREIKDSEVVDCYEELSHGVNSIFLSVFQISIP